MNARRNDFVRSIDTRYDSTTSIVLRYRNVFQAKALDDLAPVVDEWLEKTSIQEGVRIFRLLDYRGVEIYVLDETSLMHTRTLKSIDGCVTIARCKALGYDRVTFESGGNTGAALTAYGQHAGLETFLFMPEENLRLLNGKQFTSPTTHLFSVKDPNMVKEAAHLFVHESGINHIPRTEWRYEASRYRGCFILEYLLDNNSFDWITQMISAAFGPIGIYSVLTRFADDLAKMPRFLGIQQQVNSPMAQAWKSGKQTPRPTESVSAEPLLAKVMYDKKPYSYGTYNDLRDLLERTNGDLSTVSHRSFSDFLERTFEGKSILDCLADHGIIITVRDGEVVEKASLIGLAGTLDEIDRGQIEPGCRILCCLTGGTSESDGAAQPEFRIHNDESLKQFLSNYTQAKPVIEI